jgi:GTP-binding protein
VKVRAAELHATCARPDQFPKEGLPEIAFLGRSNVGKSSLLNKLVGRKKLARTSGTPGKTRLIHFFRTELEQKSLLLADLPGYGWAKVSKRERESWQKLVESYLDGRAPLRAGILLQDLRRDFSEDETLLLEWMTLHDVRPLIALTKVDKLKPMRRAQRVKVLEAEVADFAAARTRPIPVLATSSTSGQGIDGLWRALLAEL